MPLQATSGAASYDAFGGGAPVVPAYIEEVFSTYLYTGNSTARSIVNNIDLSTKGGLVWIKNRSDANPNILSDTARGITNYLYSEFAIGQVNGGSTTVTTANTDGFSIGTLSSVNYSADKFVSWTFRKQPKFFDIQTWTGTGSNRTISHSLGSVPGCIMVKRTDASGAWAVYHSSLANTEYLVLNTTAAVATGATWWNSTTPTSSVFSVGTDASVNASGGTYVAYVFAHDAGGFGLTGTDNVISCGSFTTDGGGDFSVNLGYEPQWLLIKSTTSSTLRWYLIDSMRGMPDQPGLSATSVLSANTSGAELSGNNSIHPTATGFMGAGIGGPGPYIYIAIRRGPMAVPTDATKVFNPYTATLVAGTVVNTGVTPDLLFAKSRSIEDSPRWVDRLRGYAYANAGGNLQLSSASTAAETSSTAFSYNWTNTGFTVGAGLDDRSTVIYSLRRAPSFFDEVCYTGTEVSGQTFNHNLGAVPEMMIVKARDGTTDWTAYHSALGASARIYPNATNAANTGTAAPWNSTSPTSTVFSLGNAGATNLSGTKFVNYLFATCAGVSKVGSYTGNGSTQTINCGFGAGGARFVLIKRTDAASGWYFYDTARGMTTLTDPYLFINSDAGEVATLGSVTTVSTGFALNSTILAAINVSAGTYIFLAIA
jgi:hypothetical protein